MNTVTLQIEKEDDYTLLIHLVKRLRIKILKENRINSLLRKKHDFEIILKGGDGLSIKDPVKWQREIRKDRKLPGRS